jgi:hypothetical protein
MNQKYRLALLCSAFLLLTGLAAGAQGAGGLLFGMVKPSWNPDFMPAVPSAFPEYSSIGGFGYGVSDGMIVGGFGLAFLDYDIYSAANWSSSSAVPRHAAGGVGGMILGSRIVGTRWAHLDLAARLGFGGMALSTKQGLYYDTKGYAVAYAEPYVELGLGLSPWLQLGAALGYPFIGNLIPGKPFDEALYFSPALEITVSFGSF